MDLSDSLPDDKDKAVRMEVESEFELELEDNEGLHSIYRFVYLALQFI